MVAEPKTIGEHLRRKRVDMGLTNVQVAHALGVCYQTVERWEHGRRPSKRMMELLRFHQMGWAEDAEVERGLQRDLRAARQAAARKNKA